jgi:hypothetical protein
MTLVRHLFGFGAVGVALAACATHAPAPVASGPAAAQSASLALSLDTPVGQICDDPRGRAVLDRNLPDLRKNPNYFLFQGMSLRDLARMSGGKITHEKLERVRLDLAAATASGQAGAH